MSNNGFELVLETSGLLCGCCHIEHNVDTTEEDWDIGRGCTA